MLRRNSCCTTNSRWKNDGGDGKLAGKITKHSDKYGVKHFIKFGDYNIGRDRDLLTLPNYMQFLLDLDPEEVVLEEIDTAELMRMAKVINNNTSKL